MPTQKVKHRMLVEAKRIANIEFKDRNDNLVHMGKVLPVKVIISGAKLKELEINRVLSSYPEFDPNTFKKMIRDIEIRNKQKEE